MKKCWKGGGNWRKEKGMEVKVFDLMIVNGNVCVLERSGGFMEGLRVIMI